MAKRGREGGRDIERRRERDGFIGEWKGKENERREMERRRRE